MIPNWSRAQQHAARLEIEDGEREHAGEARQHAGAPLPVGLEQHLRVARGTERGPERLELATQLEVVVDLAVVRDPAATVGARHRLVSRGAQVDDREPPVTERAGVQRRVGARDRRQVDAAHRVRTGERAHLRPLRVEQQVTLVIRPPVPQRMHRALQVLPTHRQRALRQYPEYSAHVVTCPDPTFGPAGRRSELAMTSRAA